MQTRRSAHEELLYVEKRGVNGFVQANTLCHRFSPSLLFPSWRCAFCSWPQIRRDLETCFTVKARKRVAVLHHFQSVELVGVAFDCVLHKFKVMYMIPFEFLPSKIELQMMAPCAE